MTKVLYHFDFRLFYQNEAIRSVRETMKGFSFNDSIDPLKNLGLSGKGGGFTLTFDTKDGKGLTEKANLKVVKILQEEIDKTVKKDPKIFEGLTITVLKGVRQDEQSPKGTTSSKAKDS